MARKKFYRMLSLREVVRGVMADAKAAEANGEMGSDPSTWEHPWLADVKGLTRPDQLDKPLRPDSEAK